MNVVKNADMVVLAVPSAFISDVAKQVSDLADKKLIVVNVAKGFDPKPMKECQRRFVTPWIPPNFQASFR